MWGGLGVGWGVRVGVGVGVGIRVQVGVGVRVRVRGRGRGRGRGSSAAASAFAFGFFGRDAAGSAPDGAARLLALVRAPICEEVGFGCGGVLGWGGGLEGLGDIYVSTVSTYEHACIEAYRVFTCEHAY